MTRGFQTSGQLKIDSDRIGRVVVELLWCEAVLLLLLGSTLPAPCFASLISHLTNLIPVATDNSQHVLKYPFNYRGAHTRARLAEMSTTGKWRISARRVRDFSMRHWPVRLVSPFRNAYEQLCPHKYQASS